LTKVALYGVESGFSRPAGRRGLPWRCGSPTTVSELTQAPRGTQAEFLTGTPEEIAQRLAEPLQDVSQSSSANCAEVIGLTIFTI